MAKLFRVTFQNNWKNFRGKYFNKVYTNRIVEEFICNNLSPNILHKISKNTIILIKKGKEKHNSLVS